MALKKDTSVEALPFSLLAHDDASDECPSCAREKQLLFDFI